MEIGGPVAGALHGGRGAGSWGYCWLTGRQSLVAGPQVPELMFNCWWMGPLSRGPSAWAGLLVGGARLWASVL